LKNSPPPFFRPKIAEKLKKMAKNAQKTRKMAKNRPKMQKNRKKCPQNVYLLK